MIKCVGRSTSDGKKGNNNWQMVNSLLSQLIACLNSVNQLPKW